MPLSTVCAVHIFSCVTQESAHELRQWGHCAVWGACVLGKQFMEVCGCDHVLPEKWYYFCIRNCLYRCFMEKKNNLVYLDSQVFPPDEPERLMRDDAKLKITFLHILQNEKLHFYSFISSLWDFQWSGTYHRRPLPCYYLDFSNLSSVRRTSLTFFFFFFLKQLLCVVWPSVACNESISIWKDFKVMTSTLPFSLAQHYQICLSMITAIKAKQK